MNEANNPTDTDTATGFDPRWLILREMVDHAVRSPQLVPPFEGDPGVVHVIDLACGTGSNLRFLSPRLPLPQRWLLLDYDPRLLAEATGRCAEWITRHGRAETVDVDARRCDLSGGLPSSLLEAPPSDVSAGRTMVTASALADLVSRPWLEGFAHQLTATNHVTAVLLATVYTGVVSFAPSDPDDTEVIAAFHRNMKRDKGFGPALGADAARTVLEVFAERWTVTEADSTWVLDTKLRQQMGTEDFDRLVEFQLGFFVDAASREGFNATEWGARRKRQRTHGDLEIRVGHTDLLAVRPVGDDSTVTRVSSPT